MVTIAPAGNYGAQQMEPVYIPVSSSAAAHATTIVIAAPAHQVTTPAHVTTSAAAHVTTSVAAQVTSVAAHVTTSVAAHVTTSSAVHVTTPVAHVTTSQAALPTYGSGSANWQQGNAYEDCVQREYLLTSKFLSKPYHGQ